jgi:biotin carboxyl carrier protein
MDGILSSLVPEPIAALNNHLVLGVATYVESFRKNQNKHNWDGANDFSYWRGFRDVAQKLSLETANDKSDVMISIDKNSFGFSSLSEKQEENKKRLGNLLNTELVKESYSDRNYRCVVYSSKMEIGEKLQNGTVAIQTSPKDDKIIIDVWLNGQTDDLPTHYQFKVQSPLSSAASVGLASNPVILSPMPGKIVKVYVEDGATVKKGDPVLILEAMKMEHSVSAPVDG